MKMSERKIENRFTDNGDGTVTDNITKLIWLKNANAFGLSTWEQALAFADTLSSGPHGLTDGSKAGDWRLPDVKELQSLIDFAYHNPALPKGNAFIGVQSNYYWSSTTYSYHSTHAWYMYLYDGYVDNGNKTNTYYVWPVRAGQ